MRSFIAKRILMMIPVIIGVSFVVFMVIHLSPGDPAQMMLGPEATQADLIALRTRLGLDGPLHTQYLNWLGRVAVGDFGDSIWLRRPVLGEVLDKFKATGLLAASGLFVSTVVGILIGIVAATKQYSLPDRLSMVFATLGVSMPVFWLGVVLILVFSLQLRWLPPGGMFSPAGGGLDDLLWHLILPALALAAPSTAIVARMTRSCMLEVLSQDYVRTAYAKGLVRRVVISRHALKNALIPVVTVVGMQVGYMLGGAVITEKVFSWPGLGSLMLKAISTRDFPLVQGAVLVIALSFVVVNLLVDVIYAYLDPRIRYE